MSVKCLAWEGFMKKTNEAIKCVGVGQNKLNILLTIKITGKLCWVMTECWCWCRLWIKSSIIHFILSLHLHQTQMRDKKSWNKKLCSMLCWTWWCWYCLKSRWPGSDANIWYQHIHTSTANHFYLKASAPLSHAYLVL